jgi:hypothetical protein
MNQNQNQNQNKSALEEVDLEEEEDRDLHVPNYTHEELLEALGLSGKPTRYDINHTVDQLVRQHSATDPELAHFFTEAGAAVSAAVERWSAKDATGGVTISRLINVDSFYRESLLEPADNFTCTLSEPLAGVTSLSLLSLELPQTWYNFTAAKGTNAFVFQTLDEGLVVFTREVVLPEGNYSNLLLLVAVEKALNATVEETTLFALGSIGAGPWFTLAQDPVNGLLTVKLAATFPNTVKLLWFDTSYPTLTHAKLNFNLGWALGFRYPFNALEPGTTSLSTAVVSSASSTKYLILKLDDHTSNRLSNSFVSLRTNLNDQVRLPTYAANAKLTGGSALPSAPRRLTTSQIFTITSIATTRQTKSTRNDGGDSTDIFAKIPVKHQNDWANFSNGTNKLKEDGPGKVIVEMGGTLQKNRRIYFGPVTLRKLTVSLYDDHGNLLGLNQDWSCTLEATF